MPSKIRNGWALGKILFYKQTSIYNRTKVSWWIELSAYKMLSFSDEYLQSTGLYKSLDKESI